ncbi:OmpA family protein [Georgenia thermotolerans]|uniref:OmpA family protein n=1 Tax=Georgenia thermotolerans TaxID=527326 RepID=A0A7J5UKR0_9MICO|nr:OmpA family protein [Georgenia thermotolerans]KAE8762972.1 OmpA family protein [Georgenia thermotolerans]
MEIGPHRRRAVRAAGLGVGLAVLAAGLPATAQTSAPADELGSPEIPVRATFSYPSFFLAANPEVTGAVHGVRRVDGGTAVYFSVGVAEGQAEHFAGTTAFEPAPSPYRLNDVANLALVDTSTLTAYRPLHGDVALTSSTIGMEGEPGQLVTFFAVFPELPAATTSVDLQFEWGVTASSVPVEDGPLEPAVDESFTILGEGWPKLPSADQIAAADPAAVTFDLVARSEDQAGTAAVAESPDQVEVTFDADVLFAVDSAEVSAEARARVEEIARDIADRGVGEVAVTGHTDSVRGAVDNQALSEQRAQAVADLLAPVVQDAGVTLAVAGRGPSEPVADNSTEEGRAANRRVTVVYQVSEER